jgi:hypothetical protein
MGQQAAQPAPVTLVPDRGSRKTVEVLAREPYLRLAVEEGEALLDARARQALPRTAEPIRARAREALAESREEYRQLHFGEAIARLARTEAELGALAHSSEDMTLLGALALQRGINQLALGQGDAASQAISTAIFLGYAGPAAGEFPPQVEAFVKRVRLGLESATTGGLTVRANPSSAEIWIDGKDRGVSPVTVEVKPGLHHLRVARSGHLPRAFFQQVTSGKVELAEIILDRAPVPSVAAETLQRIRAGARLVDEEPGELELLLGTGKAVLAVEATPSLRAKLIRTGRAGETACSGQRPEDLVRCLGPRLYEDAMGRPYRAAGARPAGTPVYRRWWFWTVVAAGAAAVAGVSAGIYVGTRAPSGTNVDVVAAP